MFEVEETQIFAKWLRKVRDNKIRARILVRLQRLEQGHFGDHKSVGDGVSELRLKFGSGYRIYYTEKAGKIIILLCGGDKASQNQDIFTAKAMKKELNDDS